MADNQNKLGKITGTDLLASVRDDVSALNDLGNERPIPRAGIPVSDSVNVGDTASVNVNLSSPSDSVQVSDAVTNNQYTPPYKWYFTSTTPASPPLNWNLFVWGFSS